MATFKVTITLNTNSLAAPDWIQPSIAEQLEEDEQLIEFECELVED